MKNGFFLINKPQQMTSNDVVRIIKKQFNISKVGHSGTLDPDTEGLVVIAVNKATKLIPYLATDNRKHYTAEMTFGVMTDTYDISGKVIEEQQVTITNEQVDQALVAFTKKYVQLPPIYSAKKVNGKRLYEYARNNQEVEFKGSEIEIFNLKRVGDIVDNKVSFEAIVSKGTYIRSLIVDIAESLGTIATMSKLTRTKTDGFDLKDATNIFDLTDDDFIELDDLLIDLFNPVEVYGRISELVCNGFSFTPLADVKYPIVYIDQHTRQVLAMYQKIDDTKSKPVIILKDSNANNSNN